MNLTSDQSRGYKILMSGCNASINGNAGTGKTYMLNKFIDDSRDLGKNIVIVAPTGIAALNIGGVTVHRAFKAPIGPLVTKVTKAEKIIIMADIIILDEISICRVDLFDFIAQQIYIANYIRNKNGLDNIQFVISGDFFQLPPVLPEKERETLENYYGYPIGNGFAFQSKAWSYFNFKNIVLNETMRQSDAEFVLNLNKARTGDLSCITYFNRNCSKEEFKDTILLCGTNKDAENRNISEMNKIASKSKRYKAVITGEVKESDKMTYDILDLKVGARVITLINDKDELYKNGSLGTITRMTDNGVYVKFDDGGEFYIEYYCWEICNYKLQNGKVIKEVIGTFEQLPLKIAYAITIHKSQGQTYDKANINPYCWDYGQLYVALSRVKSIEGIHLTSLIQNRFLKTSRDVQNYYRNLK